MFRTVALTLRAGLHSLRSSLDGCALTGLHSLRSSLDGCALTGLHSLRSSLDGCALTGLHSLRSSLDGCALSGLHSLRSCYVLRSYTSLVFKPDTFGPGRTLSGFLQRGNQLPTDGGI